MLLCPVPPLDTESGKDGPEPALASTKASVATSVELSPTVWVTAVDPLTKADATVFENKVPDAGRVTLVAPVAVRLTEYAPVVLNGPATVMVELLATPVPPCAADNGVVKPVRDVISELTPDLAATILVRAAAVVPHFDISENAWLTCNDPPGHVDCACADNAKPANNNIVRNLHTFFM